MKGSSRFKFDPIDKQSFEKPRKMNEIPAIRENAYNTNFYKLVNNRILVGTISEDTIVIFYFLPSHTLMNSFTEEDWPAQLSIIGDTKQIYAYMAGLSNENFQMNNQNNLVIHFQLQHNRHFNFPMQIMAKTLGHRQQQLKGCEIINRELAQHLVSLKQKKDKIENMRRYHDLGLQKSKIPLQCFVLQKNKERENKMTQVASSDFDTLVIDFQGVKKGKTDKKSSKIIDLISD